MKKILMLAFVLWLNMVKAQSLILSPDLSPTAQLRHIENGYIHSSTNNASILKFSYASSVPTIQTTTNTPLAFAIGNGTGLMWLNQQGYLSIGPSTATERLDIKKGRIRFTGQKSVSEPSGYVFTDMNGIAVFRLEMKDDDNLRIINTNSVENFVMNVNTGNVGIGIPPSAEALSISGNVHNTQLENSDSKNTILLATANGDLVKGEMDKIEVTPWNYTRFGGFGSDNYTISSGLGFYSSTNGSGVDLTAPLHLPHGVKLENIKVNLIDNSATSYIKFYLWGIGNSGSSLLVGSFDSKSSATSAALAEVSRSLNHTTDCDTMYYILSITVQKSSDDAPTFWPTSNLQLGTVTISYAY
ncbi:hypothetical protein [Emticicia soli]|uniref:DUF4402 domain-containing protein n=1 Tax=Emticicia soli TaxID=2027878 RepID=A0ABW5J2E5_9BACT